MATVNKSSQLAQLESDVANISSANTTEDLLMLSLSIGESTNNLQMFVENTDSLPNVVSSNISEGQIYFVCDIKTLVIAGDKKWSALDGRVLRCDGEPQSFCDIWGFGSNNNGQLGIRASLCSSISPIQTQDEFTDWCKISQFGYGSAPFGIRSNGTLWAWGNGCLGRLGDGTTVTKSSPVSVVGGFTDWCQVSSTVNSSAAIRTNGTLWTWGIGSLGQLGDGTVVTKCSPVSVIGGFTDWCQVAVGNAFAAAVRQNGTLWTWGWGCLGRLGDGTTVCKSSPVSVIGGFTDWCQVAAGSNSAAAVRTNGTLWTWGYNSAGQLGDGTNSTRNSPVLICGGFTDWCQASVGTFSAAAVRQNGTLWTWGLNNFGALGDGTTLAKCSPVSVVGGFTDWCQVAAGSEHTAALRTNGTLWAWGGNFAGRLGDGTQTNRSSPVSVIGGFTDWCQVSVGITHTAAIRIY